MIRRFPPLIAICGNPGSGKSEVQRILKDIYGVKPVDDGKVLRDFCVFNLGLEWRQVSTQDGKAEYVEVLGKRWQVRDMLGTLGRQLELMFGENIMPFMAVRQLNGEVGSFGSVRRNQAAFYKEQGGAVIGVRSPLAPPSPYEFDQFNQDLVDYWIDNDALARGLDKEEALKDLELKVHKAMGAVSKPYKVAV